MCDDYEEWPPIEQWVRDNFPRLLIEEFQETSDQSCVYNCIAWAAKDKDNWWWPSEDSFWPVPIEDESIQSFEHAFQVSRGYVPCESGELEQGFQKISLYAIGGKVKHMARQLDSGLWTSKLGRGWDIIHHTSDSVICDHYGDEISFMRRLRPPSTVSTDELLGPARTSLSG